MGREPVEQALLRQENRALRVFDHQRQAVRGVRWIERNIGRPCLENPVNARQQVDGSFQADADQHFRSRAQVPQVSGQFVGRTIQLIVAPLLVFTDQRHRVRGPLHLLLEELVNGRVVRIRLVSGIPGDQKPFALSVREERDARERCVETGGHVLQECREGALELENTGTIDDRRPVGPVTGASVARNRDRQIVLRSVLRFVPLHDPNRQSDVPAAQLRSASDKGTRVGTLGSHARELVQHRMKCSVRAAVTVQRDVRRDLKREELLKP